MKKITILSLLILLSINIFASSDASSVKNILTEISSDSSSSGVSFVLDKYKDLNIKKGNGLFLHDEVILKYEDKEHSSLIEEILNSTDFSKEEYTIKDGKKVYVINKDGNTVNFQFPINYELNVNSDNLIDKKNKEHEALIKEVVNNTNFLNEDYLVEDNNQVYLFEKDNHVLEFIFSNDAYKAQKHSLTFSVAPYMLKILNFHKINKQHNSKYGFGLNLSYRYNLTKHLFTGITAEYRGFIEQGLLPSTYVSEMPITLQIGNYHRFNSKFELFAAVSGGLNLGFISPYLSLDAILAQFDLGFNYFLSDNVALNVKSNVSASYEHMEGNPLLNSITIITNPISIGLSIGE